MMTALASIVGLAAMACNSEGSGLVAELNYVRSGGLAAETYELSIQPDGEAQLHGWRGAGAAALNLGESNFTLTVPELGAVTDALPSDFADLPADTTGEPVPDAFSHELSYDGHTVRTTDFAVPAEVEELLSRLQNVVEAHPLD